ncbi:hypothetical protein BC939DRAFT_228433 [Gamsiella multidivaricata]|uniref:uncharacterized protein n=1 Tax=Gamsiella multidivaricata TaxID=101098 RepID=UPI002220EF9F|nr:uncharacterized protein BC939DRAFT_228433 [Gamsiella multidivaricata]KAI7820677.1 hypothetical protein BC939DRAFT_228433 [Gamsiella multidivaricata]
MNIVSRPQVMPSQDHSGRFSRGHHRGSNSSAAGQSLVQHGRHRSHGSLLSLSQQGPSYPGHSQAQITYLQPKFCGSNGSPPYHASCPPASASRTHSLSQGHPWMPSPLPLEQGHQGSCQTLQQQQQQHIMRLHQQQQLKLSMHEHRSHVQFSSHPPSASSTSHQHQKSQDFPQQQGSGPIGISKIIRSHARSPSHPHIQTRPYQQQAPSQKPPHRYGFTPCPDGSRHRTLSYSLSMPMKPPKRSGMHQQHGPQDYYSKDTTMDSDASSDAESNVEGAQWTLQE